MELRTAYRVRFARGTVRLRPWCEVNHRPLDWASRHPTEGVRSSNHDRRCDRRDGWVGLSSARKITREPLVDDGKKFQGERNGALLRANGVVCVKKCLTGETFLEMDV